MKELNLKDFSSTKDSADMCTILAKKINELIVENQKLNETIEILLKSEKEKK